MESIEANQKHFVGEHAQKYDNEMSFRLGKEITRAILQFNHPAFKSYKQPTRSAEDIKEVPDISPVWDPDHTRVLDFACGTGIISQNLSPYVKQVVGVDIAKDMIDIFNAKVHNQGIPENEVQGYLINIFENDQVEKGRSTVPAGIDNFDAAVASLAYHHIDDIDEASQALYNRLKPEGWAFVVDLSLGPSIHPHVMKDAVVPHRGGFTPETLEKSLLSAGFTNVSSDNIFGVSLWSTEEYLSRFQAHHSVSLVKEEGGGCSGHGTEGKFKQLHGVRIYDEKVENGEKKYLIKKRLILAVGQRPSK